jgi:SAM-dependent methyltransferase
MPDGSPTHTPRPPTLRSFREFWTRTGHRERLTALLVPRIRHLEGRVLDVGGARDAPHDAAWSPRARRIRIDVSPAHRPDVIGDALALPFANEAMNVVTMFEVLEHLSEPWLAIEEARRVLGPGGTILGSAPLVWPIHGDPDDYFRFTEAGLRALLRGFSDVRVVPFGNHYSAAWILVSTRSRMARAFNPALRRLGGRPDPRAPEGYVFSARR